MKINQGTQIAMFTVTTKIIDKGPIGSNNHQQILQTKVTFLGIPIYIRNTHTSAITEERKKS